LGICLSPGAATATRRALEHVDFDLDAATDARINISGCPNSCGQHHVGHIGFFGKVARKGDKVIPAYNVISGAKVKEDETELATRVGEVAARDVPFVVRDALKQYVGKKEKYKTFEDYSRSEEGKVDLKAICENYKKESDKDLDNHYFFDWGTDKIFSVAERGKGECSAGIFDLIESDLGHIQKARKLVEEIDLNGGNAEQKANFLKDAVFYSSRVLLVSKALEPKTEQESFNFFREHFINAGLVAPQADELIKIVEAGDVGQLVAKQGAVFALADRMQLLYDVMDPSFNFKLKDEDILAEPKEMVELSKVSTQITSRSATDANATAATAAKVDVKADFRGVGCPMNFVKTKMELAKMRPHQVLEIYLDDGAPIENVPGSVREEGHKVLEQKKVGDYWSVVIEKQ
jgi:sulfite reductase (ferredoxin)